MTALAQGSAGVALVMVFGLLAIRQVSAAAILLGMQSLAVAIAALTQHQPLIAAATGLVNAIGITLLLRFMTQQSGAAKGAFSRPDVMVRWAALARMSQPAGGAKFGILVGAALAALCQSCGPLALPLAVVLLSVVLAATRRHPLMRLIAVVSLQNGIGLAACLTTAEPLPALACFFLAVPFAATLLAIPLQPGIVRRDTGLPRWIRLRLGWTRLLLSVGLLAASLLVPLDPIGAVFAPLIAFWGLAGAWVERERYGLPLVFHLAALKKLAFMLLAVGLVQPVAGWLCLATAMAAAVLPTARRGQDGVLLASCGAGLALFGLLTIPVAHAPMSFAPLSFAPVSFASVSFAAVFIGYAVVAAAVPDMGVIIGVLILRLAAQFHLPAIALGILIAVALAGLAGCLLALLVRRGGRRTTPLQLAQVSVAAVALGLDSPQARFAALVLLVLLILTRSAERLSSVDRGGGVASAALAGLGGLPPFGVFPGLVLVLLAIGGDAPWLLLPVGAGLAVTAAAILPSVHPERLLVAVGGGQATQAVPTETVAGASIGRTNSGISADAQDIGTMIGDPRHGILAARAHPAQAAGDLGSAGSGQPSHPADRSITAASADVPQGAVPADSPGPAPGLDKASAEPAFSGLDTAFPSGAPPARTAVGGSLATIRTGWTRVILAAGWVPLFLALLFGFAAPEELVRWLHRAVAGTP